MRARVREAEWQAARRMRRTGRTGMCVSTRALRLKPVVPLIAQRPLEATAEIERGEKSMARRWGNNWRGGADVLEVCAACLSQGRPGISDWKLVWELMKQTSVVFPARIQPPVVYPPSSVSCPPATIMYPVVYPPPCPVTPQTSLFPLRAKLHFRFENKVLQENGFLEAEYTMEQG